MSEEKPTPLKVEVLEKIAALITVAFGLVVLVMIITTIVTIPLSY